MTEKSKKWTDEAVAQLLEVVGAESPVSALSVEAASKALGVSSRSVAAKLRQLEREVASMAQVKVSAFTPEEGAALSQFVQANAGTLTYKQIAEQFADGKFNSKQVQGKILAMELTGSVKPAEKVEVARTYTESEEAKFIKMAQAGAYLEEIAEAMNKSLASVRGKALSLVRAEVLTKIPEQQFSHAKDSTDPVEALKDISAMTVAEIAAAVGKTERGIRTLLTRRGINVKDYQGLDKKKKAEGKAKGE